MPQAFADLEEIVVANIQRVETDQLLIMELQKNYHYIGRRMQRLGTLPSNGRRAIKRKHEVVEDTPVAVAVPVEGGGGDGGGGGEGEGEGGGGEGGGGAGLEVPFVPSGGQKRALLHALPASTLSSLHAFL